MTAKDFRKVSRLIFRHDGHNHLRVDQRIFNDQKELTTDLLRQASSVVGQGNFRDTAFPVRNLLPECTLADRQGVETSRAGQVHSRYPYCGNRK